MRRGIRLLVPALVLTAGATACSDDPTAGTLPTTSPTAPATSPSVIPPTTSHSLEDSVKDAAVGYYRTLERAGADPKDAAALEELVSPRCDCRQVVDLLHRLQREEHRLLFKIDLSGVRVVRADAQGGTVFLTVTQSAGREVDARGELVRSLPATHGDYAVNIVRSNQRWVVAQITKTA